jgi:hypothetical protein
MLKNPELEKIIGQNPPPFYEKNELIDEVYPT